MFDTTDAVARYIRLSVVGTFGFDGGWRAQIREFRQAGSGADPMTNLDSSRLVDVIRGLPASDVSVLRATLDTPDSQIGTVANSQNDIFWSVLVGCGLARELAWDPDLLQSVPRRAKTFALTAEGRSVLPRLLALACSEKGRILDE